MCSSDLVRTGKLLVKAYLGKIIDKAIFLNFRQVIMIKWFGKGQKKGLSPPPSEAEAELRTRREAAREKSHTYPSRADIANIQKVNLVLGNYI